jgi:hypothetical protein
MEFDLKRLGLGQRIAAASAVLLFIFFFFFHWYGVSIGSIDVGRNGWNSHTILRWLVLLTIVAALGAVYLRLSNTQLSLPVAPSVLVLAISALTTLLIAYRVIIDSPYPSGVDTKFGAWLGLLSLIGVTVGSFLAMQEEGISLSEAKSQMRTAAASRMPHSESTPPPPPAATPPDAPSETHPTGS